MLYPCRSVSKGTEYLTLSPILPTLVKKLFLKLGYFLKEFVCEEMLVWFIGELMLVLCKIFQTAPILAVDLIYIVFLLVFK